MKRPPFDFVVVDEAQDMSVAQLRFLAALGGGGPNSLFFAGDLGQRIFQQPFSWKALGVDVRGRSSTLRDQLPDVSPDPDAGRRLLGAEVADVDGNTEDRRGTMSVFNGPAPVVAVLRQPRRTRSRPSPVGSRERIAEGVKPHEIGVFVRSDGAAARARAAVERGRAALQVLDDRVETRRGRVSDRHHAPGQRPGVPRRRRDGLRRRGVPLQERIETVADDRDLEEVYDTERHLLYVACTRARDHLLVGGTNLCRSSSVI